MKRLIKNPVTLILAVVLLHGTVAYGQVDAIKQKSAGHSSGGERHVGSSAGSSLAEGLFRAIFFAPFSQWQQEKLSKVGELPWLRSAEVFAQGAAQPSDYYILTPRIRGNYGLFSTDFRINYLIEEDFGKPKTLHTYDWQIIELNVITTRHVTWRIGGGILSEAFGDKKTYGEWTTQLSIHPSRSRWSGTGEFRSAESRKEGSAIAEYAIFDQSLLHISLSGGMIFQRYYGAVDVWGMQLGAVIRIY